MKDVRVEWSNRTTENCQDRKRKKGAWKRFMRRKKELTEKKTNIVNLFVLQDIQCLDAAVVLISAWKQLFIWHHPGGI